MEHLIEPSLEEFVAFLQAPVATPLVMINLLKYRARAAYPAGFDATPCSGREAYERYGAVAVEKLAAVGARIVWIGGVDGCVIAPADESWDDVAVVQYPSRQAMLAMISMPDYQAAAVHRTAGLENTRLIATTTQGGGFAPA
jgi:uncharacterized protein (DUF1330 family)